MSRVLRVFPRRTSYTPRDAMVFVGDPPMFRPEADEVHVSVAFTWDIPAAERLQQAWGQYYDEVLLGGPAYGSPVGTFTPGQYLMKGVTFTTRGCNRHCPWCLVPEREGRLATQEFPDGYIIQDNNLLQAPRQHIEKVFQMLKRQKRGAIFAGGIQPSLVTPWFADLMRTITVNQVFLAADTKGAIRPLAKAVAMLGFLGRNKLRAFTLIAFNGETVPQAEERLEAVWETGAMPFAQLYQPPDQFIHYTREWKALARTWMRPAAMRTLHKEATA